MFRTLLLIIIASSLYGCDGSSSTPCDGADDCFGGNTNEPTPPDIYDPAPSQPPIQNEGTGTSYTYDEANRLKSIHYVSTSLKVIYAYDVSGNIISISKE